MERDRGTRMEADKMEEEGIGRRKNKRRNRITMNRHLEKTLYIFQRRILSPNGSTFESWCLTTPKVCTVHSITYPRFVWNLILLPSNNVSNNCGEREERQSEILVSSNRIKSVSLTEFS